MLRHSPAFGKDIPRLNFLFCLRGGDGCGEGLGDRTWILGVSSSDSIVSSKGDVQETRRGSSSEWKVLSSVVVWGVSQLFYALTFMGGVEIGDGSDGSGDSGLYCSLLSCVCVRTAIVLRILKGLVGRFKSFRHGRTMGSCRPNPYGIVGSLESSSIVNICGSGDAINDIEGVRAMCCSDVSVELRILSVLCLCGLSSLELFST